MMEKISNPEGKVKWSNGANISLNIVQLAVVQWLGFDTTIGEKIWLPNFSYSQEMWRLSLWYYYCKNKRGFSSSKMVCMVKKSNPSHMCLLKKPWMRRSNAASNIQHCKYSRNILIWVKLCWTASNKCLATEQGGITVPTYHRTSMLGDVQGYVDTAWPGLRIWSCTCQPKQIWSFYSMKTLQPTQ